MKKELLVSDANVLIDFHSAEPELLVFLCKEFNVKISKVVMDEIEEFTHAQAIEFGMEIIDSEDMQEIHKIESSRLSFQDKSCIVLSQRLKASCLTNDKSLKNYLTNLGIQTYWGLQILLLFVERNYLSKDRVEKIAKQIFETNCRYGENTKDNFQVQLGKLP